jgi:hypothetical protein
MMNMLVGAIMNNELIELTKDIINDACYECGKGEMVYRPVDPQPLMVSFVAQSSKDGRVWEDYFIGDTYSSESEAIGVAIEQHERYHFTNNYRLISRVEKVLWKGKKYE